MKIPNHIQITNNDQKENPKIPQYYIYESEEKLDPYEKI